MSYYYELLLDKAEIEVDKISVIEKPVYLVRDLSLGYDGFNISFGFPIIYALTDYLRKELTEKAKKNEDFILDRTGKYFNRSGEITISARRFLKIINLAIDAKKSYDS